MITYEEITGYFDLSAPWDTSKLPDSLFECTACRAWIGKWSLAWHIEWHQGLKKSDKDKTPEEIRQEAKRILAEMRRWEK